MTETTKQIYRVRGIDLDHDGDRYPEGADIVLTDEEAAGLRNWIDPAEQAATAASAPRSGRHSRAAASTQPTGSNEENQ